MARMALLWVTWCSSRDKRMPRLKLFNSINIKRFSVFALSFASSSGVTTQSVVMIRRFNRVIFSSRWVKGSPICNALRISSVSCWSLENNSFMLVPFSRRRLTSNMISPAGFIYSSSKLLLRRSTALVSPSTICL